MSLDIYNASAGSGKTYTLTREYLRRLLGRPDPRQFRSVLAVTFTNKAADEMKNRILSALDELATGRNAALANELAEALELSSGVLQERALLLRNAILHDYSHFSVSTIDKFFQKIIRAFMHEAGLLPGFNVELDTGRLLDEGIERLLLQSAANPQLQQWIISIVEKQLEEGRHWDIRKNLQFIGAEIFKESFQSMPLQALERLNDRQFLGAYIRELKKIAGDFEVQMRSYGESALQLLREHGLSVADFKYKSSSFANYFNNILKGDYEPKGRSLEAIDNLEKWYGSEASKRGQIDNIYTGLNRILSDAVRLYQTQFIDYNTASQVLRNIHGLGLLADMAKHINDFSSEENSLSISESLNMLTKLIGNSDTPFVYEKTGAHYHSFLLDEFQDTSTVQWNSLRPLLSNSMAEGGEALIVGDVKQSIYRWRNGDWRILAYQLNEDFRHTAIRHQSLDTNWRSCRTVVDANNELFAALPALLQARVNETLGQAGLGAGKQYLLSAITTSYEQATQHTSPRKKEEEGFVCIEFPVHSDERKADEEVLQRLPELVAGLTGRGYRLSDIAMLVRSNREGERIAATLLQHGYNIISQESLFISRAPVVQFIIAQLYRTVYPADAINRSVITYYLQQTGRPVEQDEPAELGKQALSEAVETVIRHFSLDKDAADIPFIQELHDVILQYTARNSNDIYSFLQWWAEHGEKLPLQVSSDQDAIRIMTIHKSKGLQFRVCVMPFCNWPFESRIPSLLWAGCDTAPFNRLPLLPLTYGSALAETHFKDEFFTEKVQQYIDNLNLLYVAFTRAEEELYVFCPQSSNSYTVGKALQEAAGGEKFERGRQLPARPGKAPEATQVLELPNYPALPYLNRLRLRYRDEEDGVETATSLRDYGILMHRAFSSIKTREDVGAAVAALAEEGFIAGDQATTEALHKELQAAIDQAGVTQWFDGSRRVLSEMNILLPAQDNALHQLRPDRVMFCEGKVEVVDYKFGEKEEPSYEKQLQRYMACLQEMGYESVAGYIWYVNKKKIIAVSRS